MGHGSFYGTTFKEFKEVFNKIKTRNSLKSDKDSVPKETPPDATVMARGLEDSITLKSGNYWIKVDGDDSAQAVTISHAAPNTETTGVSTDVFSVEDEDVENATQLKPGQCFTIRTEFCRDHAGHLNGFGSTETFKLPQTDAEVELEDIKDRLDALELFQEETIPETYETQENVSLINERLTKAETFIDEVPATYATLEKTGLPSDLYLADSTDYAEKYPSITSLLGNIQSLNQELGYINETKTLSDALKEFLTGLENTVAVINVAVKGLDASVSNLETRVSELENQE